MKRGPLSDLKNKKNKRLKSSVERIPEVDLISGQNNQVEPTTAIATEITPPTENSFPQDKRLPLDLWAKIIGDLPKRSDFNNFQKTCKDLYFIANNSDITPLIFTQLASKYNMPKNWDPNNPSMRAKAI